MASKTRAVFVLGCLLAVLVLVITSSKRSESLSLSDPDGLGPAPQPVVDSVNDVNELDDVTHPENIISEPLPTGSLETLEKQLAEKRQEAAALRAKVAESHSQEEQTLDVMLTEGKEVAKTARQAKIDALDAKNILLTREKEMTRSQQLLKKAQDDINSANLIEKQISIADATAAANVKKLQTVQSPLSEDLKKITEDGVKINKDEMKLAEKETEASKVQNPTTEKKSLLDMIMKVDAEDKVKRGLEKRVQQIEAIVSKIPPPIDPDTLKAEEYKDKQTAEKLEAQAASLKEEASADAAEAKQTIGKRKKLQEDAATTLKLASEEQKQLKIQMKKNALDKQAYHSLLEKLGTVTRDEDLLQQAIAQKEPQTNSQEETNKPAPTIPADAVDRAANGISDGDDGPLAAEAEAEKQKKIDDKKKKKVDAAREERSVIDNPLFNKEEAAISDSIK